MEHIIELVLELIGAIVGSNEPIRMPRDLEFSEHFTVKPYPKDYIGSFAIDLLAFAIVPFAYIGNGLAFALLFATLGVALLIFSFFGVCKYEVDCEKIVSVRAFFFKKTVRWESVRSVKFFTETSKESVVLALFDERKCLIDFVTPMKNFWSVYKMAEHLRFEIIHVHDAPLKKYWRA